MHTVFMIQNKTNSDGTAVATPEKSARTFEQTTSNIVAFGKALTAANSKPATIIMNDVCPKPYRGRQQSNTQGRYNAEITPRESVRIFGTMTNRVHGAVDFDKTFKVGDVAEYGSFNLIYTGEIVSIGEKTVGIKNDNGRTTRLDIYAFIDRNFDFSVERIEKHNAAEMQCI